MTPTLLVAAFAVGAAGLALWLHVRLPKLSPTDLRPAIVHVLVAFGLVQLAPVALRGLIAYEPSVALATAGLLAVFLPSLTYAFLSAVWVMRLLQRALPAR